MKMASKNERNEREEKRNHKSEYISVKENEGPIFISHLVWNGIKMSVEPLDVLKLKTTT